MSASTLLPLESITHRILLLREQKVLLDADLAALYGVETKVLLQAVKRNLERFPEDFMFQLTNQEFNVLRSQSVTSSSEALETLRWGGRRTAPYAFTEQGVAMLSSILSSPQAVQVNIAIMRAFVKLRELAMTHTTSQNNSTHWKRKPPIWRCSTIPDSILWMTYLNTPTATYYLTRNEILSLRANGISTPDP